MRSRLFVQFAVVVLLSTGALAEPVPVRFAEGIVHGFLSLRTADGALVANGDLIQVARGDRVTSRLVFHFKDGSLRDETSVFSQRQNFRLISNNLIQKGPTFPQPLDLRQRPGAGCSGVAWPRRCCRRSTRSWRLLPWTPSRRLWAPRR